MLTEQQLDQFIDEFWEDTPNEAQEEEPAEDLEEYTLPSDGMIIQQMEKKGKVNRKRKLNQKEKLIWKKKPKQKNQQNGK